jgi:hypothetical protein
MKIYYPSTAPTLFGVSCRDVFSISRWFRPKSLLSSKETCLLCDFHRFRRLRLLWRPQSLRHGALHGAHEVLTFASPTSPTQLVGHIWHTWDTWDRLVLRPAFCCISKATRAKTKAISMRFEFMFAQFMKRFSCLDCCSCRSQTDARLLGLWWKSAGYWAKFAPATARKTRARNHPQKEYRIIASLRIRHERNEVEEGKQRNWQLLITENSAWCCW